MLIKQAAGKAAFALIKETVLYAVKGKIVWQIDPRQDRSIIVKNVIRIFQACSIWKNITR